MDLGSGKSKTIIDKTTGEIRRASNGKMYMASEKSDNLTIIDDPEGIAKVSELKINVPIDGTWKLIDALPLHAYQLFPAKVPDVEVPDELDAKDLFSRNIGNKFYELTDHLGNVRALVKDVKGSNLVVSANNYYPFGMFMPGRAWSQSDAGYRFGFNGMEKDDEVKGMGIHIQLYLGSMIRGWDDG